MRGWTRVLVLLLATVAGYGLMTIITQVYLS